MDPQVSVGAFAQAAWPGAGDVDDCWAVSDLQALHAAAPWAQLPTIPKWRAAAGNPDRPGPSGGTIPQSARAFRALAPGIPFAAYDAPDALTFAAWAMLVQAGRVASVEVISASLPVRVRYGFPGRHRVLIFWRAEAWEILNPLAPPHSRSQTLSAGELKAAVTAAGPGVRSIVMGTPAEAFRVHPLLASAIAAATQDLRTRLDHIAALAVIP